MRPNLTPLLLIAATLTGCSTQGNIPPSKHISQSGPLQIHPDLIAKPRPAASSQPATSSTQSPAPAGAVAAPVTGPGTSIGE